MLRDIAWALALFALLAVAYTLVEETAACGSWQQFLEDAPCYTVIDADDD